MVVGIAGWRFACNVEPRATHHASPCRHLTSNHAESARRDRSRFRLTIRRRPRPKARSCRRHASRPRRSVPRQNPFRRTRPVFPSHGAGPGGRIGRASPSSRRRSSIHSTRSRIGSPRGFVSDDSRARPRVAATLPTTRVALGTARDLASPARARLGRVTRRDAPSIPSQPVARAGGMLTPPALALMSTRLQSDRALRPLTHGWEENCHEPHSASRLASIQR